eukprot:4090913-Amphidinium_carterae.1
MHMTWRVSGDSGAYHGTSPRCKSFTVLELIWDSADHQQHIQAAIHGVQNSQDDTHPEQLFR